MNIPNGIQSPFLKQENKSVGNSSFDVRNEKYKNNNDNQSNAKRRNIRNRNEPINNLGERTISNSVQDVPSFIDKNNTKINNNNNNNKNFFEDDFIEVSEDYDNLTLDHENQRQNTNLAVTSVIQQTHTQNNHQINTRYRNRYSKDYDYRENKAAVIFANNLEPIKNLDNNIDISAQTFGRSFELENETSSFVNVRNKSPGRYLSYDQKSSFSQRSTHSQNSRGNSLDGDLLLTQANTSTSGISENTTTAKTNQTNNNNKMGSTNNINELYYNQNQSVIDPWATDSNVGSIAGSSHISQAHTIGPTHNIGIGRSNTLSHVTNSNISNRLRSAVQKLPHASQILGTNLIKTVNIKPSNSSVGTGISAETGTSRSSTASNIARKFSKRQFQSQIKDGFFSYRDRKYSADNRNAVNQSAVSLSAFQQNNFMQPEVQLANSAVPQRTNLPAVVTRSKSFIAREKTLSLMSATTGQNLISNSTNNQNLPNSFQRQKTFSTGQNSIPGQVTPQVSQHSQSLKNIASLAANSATNKNNNNNHNNNSIQSQNQSQAIEEQVSQLFPEHNPNLPMDQQIRDMNTALRQHSDALGRLAQRLRATEERANTSFTSQDQLLSRIEKLENFVVRSDADRRRNEDQTLQQIQQLRQRLDDMVASSSRNSRVSQQISSDIEHIKKQISDGPGTSNFDGRPSGGGGLEARLATLESKLQGGSGGVKALIAQNQNNADSSTLKDLVSRLEKQVATQNERFNVALDTVKSKIKITSEELINMNGVLTEKEKIFQAFKSSQMSKEEISISINSRVRNSLMDMMDDITNSNKHQYNELASKCSKIELQLQTTFGRKMSERLEKLDDLEYKSRQYGEELQAIQRGCESLAADFTKLTNGQIKISNTDNNGLDNDPESSLIKQLEASEKQTQMLDKIDNQNKVISEMEKKLDKYKIDENKILKTEILNNKLDKFEKGLKDRFDEHWQNVKRMVEHEVKHSKSKAKASQEAVELAVKALAAQLDHLGNRVDEERDLMIDNIVEHFNNKNEDLDAKVDDLYTKLVNGVKKYTQNPGTPMQKEVAAKIMEVEKSIRKDLDRKYNQINKTVQQENSSMRGLVTRERQTACTAVAKVERELARLEGKLQTETRKLEKSVISDQSKCINMETKIEGIQDTFQSKLKVIIANMDHEIDDIRNNIGMDQIDSKNDLMQNLDAFKNLEAKKLHDVESKLENILSNVTKTDHKITEQSNALRDFVNKKINGHDNVIDQTNQVVADLGPQIEGIRGELGNMKQQLALIKTSLRSQNSGAVVGGSSHTVHTSGISSETDSVHNTNHNNNNPRQIERIEPMHTGASVTSVRTTTQVVRKKVMKSNKTGQISNNPNPNIDSETNPKKIGIPNSSMETLTPNITGGEDNSSKSEGTTVRDIRPVRVSALEANV